MTNEQMKDPSKIAAFKLEMFASCNRKTNFQSTKRIMKRVPHAMVLVITGNFKESKDAGHTNVENTQTRRYTRL